jgi:hypothetical protein
MMKSSSTHDVAGYVLNLKESTCQPSPYLNREHKYPTS